MHEWHICAGMSDASYVIATCTRCGLIRTQAAPGSQQERHIDLRGACPGEPQEPEREPVQKDVGAGGYYGRG